MLKSLYSSKDEIPAEYAALFAEKNGQWEIQIEGAKTPADVERLQTALQKERDAHKETKAQIRKFDWVGDLTEDSVTQLRDQVEDLKTKGGAKGPSEEEIEELVEKRAERKLRQPLRELDEAKKLIAQRDEAISMHVAAANQRRIRDHVEEVLGRKDAPKVVDGAREDILPFAERIMTVNERGEVVTRENVGFEPGVGFDEILGELKTAGKRTHWFPASQGAGASGNEGGGAPTGNNPFAEKSFNLTEIGKIVTGDRVRALMLARQAGRADLIAQFQLDVKK